MEIVALKIHVDIESSGLGKRSKSAPNFFALEDSACRRAQFTEGFRKVEAPFLKLSLSRQVFASVFDRNRRFRSVPRYRKLANC
jgi:hypothetical protein